MRCNLWRHFHFPLMQIKDARTELDFGQFRQRAGERILQGKLIRRGILLLSRLGRDIKEIDTPRILPFEPSLTR